MKNYFQSLARLKRIFTLLFIAILYSYTTEYDVKIPIPDSSFEKSLIFLGIDSDLTVNGLIKESDVQKVTELDLTEQEIYDLRGIEYFTSLERLDVSNNNLQRLSLSKLTKLEKVDCSFNSLLYLELSKSMSYKDIKYYSNPDVVVSWK
jgi:Leucine-rich repeat (LRR) protein